MVDSLRGCVFFGQEGEGGAGHFCVSSVDAELEVKEGEAERRVLDEGERDEGGHDLERLLPAFLDCGNVQSFTSNSELFIRFVNWFQVWHK